jgi:hypothetical protein
MMLKSRQLLSGLTLVALSMTTVGLGSGQIGVFGEEDVYMTIMVADNGNPWALPMQQPMNRYGEQSQPQPYQSGPRFITPEEMKSIYKNNEPDQNAQQPNQERSSGNKRNDNYMYTPGPTFDPLQPGTFYPGVNGGVYEPYGLSPYYTPNIFNSVSPFIY